jgi:hypothetical protein
MESRDSVRRTTPKSVHFADSVVLETRLSAVESRLADVEASNSVIVREHMSLKKSVMEHDEWMGKLETKFDAVRSSVDKVRAEVRATSYERIVVVCLVMFVVFVFWAMV